MTLSKRGDYVVRSALALARAWPSGRPRKIREVVAEMAVPQTFASQVLADLVKSGLATAKAGKDGGYRLTRDPVEIPLVEVVEAGEGPLRADRCALGDGPCRWDAVCPLHDTWRAATEALRRVLGAITLADLARRDLEIEQGRLLLPADSHRRAGTSVEVEDWIDVEVAADLVIARLRSPDTERLTRTVEAAYLAAEGLRTAVQAWACPWAPVRALVTCVRRPEGPGGDPDGPAPAPGPGPATAFAVAWETVGTDEVASRGEIELRVRAVDAERARLSLTGRLRPPASASTLPLEADLLPRLTNLLTRSLLRHLARDLEAGGPDIQPSPASGDGTATSRGSSPCLTGQRLPAP